VIKKEAGKQGVAQNKEVNYETASWKITMIKSKQGRFTILDKE